MSSLAVFPNPFHSSVVSDPWQIPETDVPCVHQSAFMQCCEAVSAVRAQHRTTSVLVHGQAGSGKTHLLARFRAHLIEEAKADGPDSLQEAIFISVRLQTGARMIWRHLLRCMVEDLLRRHADGSTQIERVLIERLIESGVILGSGWRWLTQKWLDTHSSDLHDPIIDAFFEKIDRAQRLGYNLRTVLRCLLLGRHRALATAWLRGESLPESALEKLGIAAEPEIDEELEERARRMVIALASLATAELPIIFCFDQVEALQLDPGDFTGLIAFGQMISTLHADTKHALLISCIQSAYLNTLDSKDSKVREADLARIREYAAVSLSPLNWDEAKRLICARLDWQPELRQLRASQSDMLWPLSEIEIKKEFTQTGYPARKLISHCAELFEAKRRGEIMLPPPRPTPIAQFLAEAMEVRRQKSLEASDSAQIEAIINHGLPSLIHLLRKEWRQNYAQIPQGIDLVFESPEGRIAFSFCNHKPGPALVRKLDQLIDCLTLKHVDKLILLRDSRHPLKPTSVVSRTKRDELVRQGACWIEPSLEAIAALDALRALLSDAKSGELDNRGETIGWETVQDWLISNLSTELKNLLDEILPPGSSSDPVSSLFEDISEYLQGHHVVSITDLSTHLGREKSEIESCVEQHSDRIGVLGEPPTVLFRLVVESFAA